MGSPSDLMKQQPAEASQSSAEAGGCPVIHDGKNDGTTTTAASSSPSWFSSLWSKSKIIDVKKEEQQQQQVAATEIPEGCPVSSSKSTGLVASVEESASYSQKPHPAQGTMVLSTDREVSSIPKGSLQEGEKVPHHQKEEDENRWVYPSEQQFFNALRRKGWDHVEAESVPTVVQIHNTINERTWKLIQEWEQTPDIRLVRFQGRPKDLSPLAMWKHYIMQITPHPPFDRHDWHVQKNNETATTRRYVIDYYMMPNPLQQFNPDAPPKTVVDVRPALDSPYAMYRRFIRLCQDEFVPNLLAEWNSRSVLQGPPKYYDGRLPTRQASVEDWQPQIATNTTKAATT